MIYWDIVKEEVVIIQFKLWGQRNYSYYYNRDPRYFEKSIILDLKTQIKKGV
jgi:hypothetical protein